MPSKTIRSEKLRKKRRRIFFIRMSLFFLVVCSFLGLLMYAFNANTFEIQQVQVSGGQAFVDQEIRRSVEEFLAGSYFGVVSKRNVLLYPKKRLEDHVKESFPRVRSLTFELDPFKEHTLNLSITERRENGVWCRTQNENLDCYFLDKDGYIFAPAPTYSDGVVFTYYGFIEGDPVGQQYIDGEILTSLNAFIRAVENSSEFSGYAPIGLEYLKDAEYKLLLKGGAYILLTDTYGLARAYENLIASFSEQSVVLSDLEYIDIRIPNKVFYKKSE